MNIAADNAPAFDIQCCINRTVGGRIVGHDIAVLLAFKTAERGKSVALLGLKLGIAQHDTLKLFRNENSFAFLGRYIYLPTKFLQIFDPALGTCDINELRNAEAASG